MNLAPSQPNRQIELRPWREADLPLMMQLRNDVALQAQLLAELGHPDPYAEESPVMGTCKDS